ncbi:MAG: alpha-mannosidase, partial [Ktedonobacterales bacterium]|nr:alpha-mannosidase [Ktedonobacterales bacterium]
TISIALLQMLDDATLALDFTDGQPGGFARSCRQALAGIQAGLSTLALPSGDPWQPHTVVTGHAHIDVAWLWRLRHTRMKTANTFTTALYHMERAPDFIFTASTPQLYQFVKEDHPDIYARIRARIAAGQWEAEGAMWVEADTNITGAESLARQFIMGKRFFRDEFGIDSRVLWLPDVFGYSAALPQLMKEAGVDYFLTTKISWNDTNRAPMDTFWWEGLDGSRVLAHFITAQNADTERYYTYNAEAWPGVMARTWRNYRQQALNRELLVAYGWGDGGGGPTREMVEAAQMQMPPISREIPSAAPGTVRGFMERLAARVGDDPRLPLWAGELYFEYHRGTYTSQARTKRNNRLAERDLHNAEWLAALAQHMAGQPYPFATLDAAWQVVLTHQFHDILPGSSISEVYQDAEANYAQVRATTDNVITAALAAITAAVAAPAGSLVAFNGLSWSRGGLVEVPPIHAAALDLPQQTLPNGQTLVRVPAVPALGYQAIQPSASARDDTAASLTVTPTLLENDFVRVELNARGQITRIFDKVQAREVLAPDARGNVFQLFEDKPLNFDAWDIDAFYAQKQWELDDLVQAEVEESGPLRATLRLQWRYLDRTLITQRIRLTSDSAQIDFVTEVEWHEQQTLLKTAFPVAVHNSFATAEIQFGNIRRPTHRNTSWEQAQFETSGHKWVDLSEGDYGVALLNDCKYGYDVRENVMRLTLLKGAISPDPQADQGHHVFTYSLLPHAGDWFAGGVAQAAYALNHPLLVATTTGDEGTLPAALALATVTPTNVIIETVKRAERTDFLTLRLYECANRRGTFTVTLPFVAASVNRTNLLEDAPEGLPLSADGHSFTGSITPYQVVTVVVRPKA